jgi:succinoglycan biosynthesis protein ExoU
MIESSALSPPTRSALAAGGVGLNSANPDKVAVLIAARDSAETIARAVRSALAQPAVAEVIVVDDESHDDTAARARACDDGTERIRVSVLPRNLGPAAARNRAFDLSTAPIVGVLDADDHFAPGRIETLLGAAGEDWDLAADGIVMLRNQGAVQSVQRLDFHAMVGSDILRAEQFIAGNIVRRKAARTEFGFMKPLIRRAFLERHGIRFDEGLRLGEDYALYAEALLHGARFRLIPSCGYTAVWRADSLSGRHSAGDLLALAAADTRLAETAATAPDVLQALQRHRADTVRRADYRILLDLKQARRYRRCAAFALARPAVLLHAVREKLLAVRR